MKTYQFALIASGLDPQADDFEDRLFEAGCDDATVSLQKGLIILDFSRQAKSFAHAVVSAVQDVEKAGAKADHLEPDHLVSLSDIAARTGLTRAAISLYANGARGKDFPRPIARITSESPLWDWVDVARWMVRHAKLEREAVLRARFIKTVNRTLKDTAQSSMALGLRT